MRLDCSQEHRSKGPGGYHLEDSLGKESSGDFLGLRKILDYLTIDGIVRILTNVRQVPNL